jgi:hypothetical protein
MEEIKPELKLLVKETFDAIKTFNEFIQKNTITDTITSANIKEDSISRASYKGPEGEFRVTLDHRISKITVFAKFGTDKYEVSLDQYKFIVKGVRLVFLPCWSCFNSVFNKVKSDEL